MAIAIRSRDGTYQALSPTMPLLVSCLRDGQQRKGEKCRGSMDVIHQRNARQLMSTSPPVHAATTSSAPDPLLSHVIGSRVVTHHTPGEGGGVRKVPLGQWIILQITTPFCLQLIYHLLAKDCKDQHASRPNLQHKAAANVPRVFYVHF